MPWYHLYDQHTDTHYLNGAMLVDPSEAELRPGFVYLEGDAPADSELFVEKSPQEQLVDSVGQAYMAFTEEQQQRFEPDLMRAAFFLQNNNMPRVNRVIAEMEQRLEPQGDENVAAVIDQAKQLLANIETEAL